MYLLLFSGKNWECFKVQFSVAVFVYILSSKRASQLQVVFIRTLENIQGKFYTEAALLKCITGNFFFWKFAQVLGQHVKSTLWKIIS